MKKKFRKQFGWYYDKSGKRKIFFFLLVRFLMIFHSSHIHYLFQMHWCTSGNFHQLYLHLLMNHDAPLPLIQPSIDLDSDEESQDVSATLFWYGYAVLAISWTLFIVTANTVFLCWKFVIEPLSWTESTKYEYDYLYVVFSTIDEYVMSLWGVYVVAWWWALFSWVGLKLFKQSKGIQT